MSYQDFGRKHARCNAHHLRELVAAGEARPERLCMIKAQLKISDGWRTHIEPTPGYASAATSRLPATTAFTSSPHSATTSPESPGYQQLPTQPEQLPPIV
jgi:hypothetical protein